MIFLKSDSKKYSRNCNFFIYRVILAYNSSKCSSLYVLIPQVKKSIFRVKRSLSADTIIWGLWATYVNLVKIGFFTKCKIFRYPVQELIKPKILVRIFLKLLEPYMLIGYGYTASETWHTFIVVVSRDNCPLGRSLTRPWAQSGCATRGTTCCQILTLSIGLFIHLTSPQQDI